MKSKHIYSQYFPWIVTNDIKAVLVTNNVSWVSFDEDIKNLKGEDCNTSNLIYNEKKEGIRDNN